VAAVVVVAAVVAVAVPRPRPKIMLSRLSLDGVIAGMDKGADGGEGKTRGELSCERNPAGVVSVPFMAVMRLVPLVVSPPLDKEW
jgi:hypothetical protein